MAIADDGSVVLGGNYNDSDFLVVKLDANGNFQWQWTVRYGRTGRHVTRSFVFYLGV